MLILYLSNGSVDHLVFKIFPLKIAALWLIQAWRQLQNWLTQGSACEYLHVCASTESGRGLLPSVPNPAPRR